MSGYIEIVKQSFMFFPLVAFVLTFPYILYNYHKYGSIFSLRIIIVYSFVLYLMTVYFLIILPLPEIEEVEMMTGAKWQPIPFGFVGDIINEIKLTGKPIYLCQSLFQVLFNIVMTIPFGMYLRYYFKFDLKKTLITSFLLSLFFELTQLSGLYFIYPRPYRLFDLDDLFANTLGGVIGYYLVKPFYLILPDRDKIDEHSRQLGLKVSLFRRLTAMGIDVFNYIIISSFVSILLEKYNIEGHYIISISFIYLVVIPILLQGRTIGQWFVKIRYQHDSGKYKPLNILVLYITELFIVFGIPVVFGAIADFLLANIIDYQYHVIIKAIIFFTYVFALVTQALLLLFNSQSIGQRVAKLRLISTTNEK